MDKEEKGLWGKVKKTAQVGALIAGGLAGVAGMGGCYYNQHYNKQEPFFACNYNKQEPFFACNYWIDRNQDGMVDFGEYEGVKDSFRSFESITIVSTIYNKRGANLKCIVWSPAGIPVSEDKSVVSFDVNISRLMFSPHQLKSLGGVGRYRAVWYVEDNPVNTTDFQLLD